MSERRLTYTVFGVTPNANPYTMVQIEAGANHRALLDAVEIAPAGSSGPTVPLLFDFILQDDAVGLSDVSANIVELPPVATAGAKTVSCHVHNTGEPGVTATRMGVFSLHQQGSRLWIPPTRDRCLLIEPTKRLGIRLACAIYVSMNMTFYMRE